MGAKTKIDWCDATWNPVTGCLHGCEYCYAKGIAKRFGRAATAVCDEEGYPEYGGTTCADGTCHDLHYPIVDYGRTQRAAPYPFEFDPTFHRYRLADPQHWKKPRNIFVCSMADLFGEWVPDEWIAEVFRACDAAPQHRYLFLTKNPDRYLDLANLMPKHRRPPNVAEMWFGRSFTGAGPDYVHVLLPLRKTFVSIEPLLRRLSYKEAAEIAGTTNWVIVGAETGHRDGKVTPKKTWIYDIIAACEEMNTPVFMKESLRELMGPDFRQEFPWEVSADEA